MGKPSRTRDVVGALLLVLVGLLYMTGVSELPAERGAEADVGGEAEVWGVSGPSPAQIGLDYRT